MPHGVAVVTAEPVAPIVTAAAVLSLAGLSIDQPFIRTDAEVAAADIELGAGLDRADASAAVAVGAVDPIVEPPNQTIDAMLRVAWIETDKQLPAHVRLAVTVGVLGIENLRGTRDKYSAAPRHDIGGKAQAIEK